MITLALLIAVIVTVDATNSSTLDPEQLYVKVGSTVPLHCSLDRDEADTGHIVWYHGDSRIGNASDERITAEYGAEHNRTVLTSVLRISRVRPSDSGNYTCSLSSNSSTMASFVLHVLTGESPAVVHHSNHTLVSISSTVHHNLHTLFACSIGLLIIMLIL